MKIVRLQSSVCLIQLIEKVRKDRRTQYERAETNILKEKTSEENGKETLTM